MLNEVILTTTVCFAIVAFMALIYGEMRLLQKTAKQRQGMSLVATLEKPGCSFPTQQGIDAYSPNL